MFKVGDDNGADLLPLFVLLLATVHDRLEYVRRSQQSFFQFLRIDVLSRSGDDHQFPPPGDPQMPFLQAADIAGLRTVIVHVKDAAAKAFYEKFGFQPSPLDELHLMLLLKDVRKTLTD